MGIFKTLNLVMQNKAYMCRMKKKIAFFNMFQCVLGLIKWVLFFILKAVMWSCNGYKTVVNDSL